MTEMVNNGMSQSSDNSSSQPVATSSAPSQSVSSDTNEKLLKQSDVDSIVGRAKAEAYERGKREYSSSQQQQSSSQPQAQSQPQTLGGMPQVTENEVRKLAAQEASRLRDEWIQESQQKSNEQEATRIAQEFTNKLDTGKAKYQDWDQTVGDVEFKNIPHIVQLANMVDNTADVMYDLAQNPEKIGNLQQLINTSPKLAYNLMVKMSQRLKDNEAATNFKLPKSPLNHMRPSNTGTDTGAMKSVSDYRRNPNYRA